MKGAIWVNKTNLTSTFPDQVSAFLLLMFSAKTIDILLWHTKYSIAQWRRQKLFIGGFMENPFLVYSMQYTYVTSTNNH